MQCISFSWTWTLIVIFFQQKLLQRYREGQHEGGELDKSEIIVILINWAVYVKNKVQTV